MIEVKMVKGKKLGLVGRCLLAGSLALGVVGCMTEAERARIRAKNELIYARDAEIRKQEKLYGKKPEKSEFTRNLEDFWLGVLSGGILHSDDPRVDAGIRGGASGLQAGRRNDAIRDSGTEVNINVGQNAQNSYITEIYNLDTGKKEIVIAGWWHNDVAKRIFIDKEGDYIWDKMKNDAFPEKGYKIVKKDASNGPFLESYIVTKEEEKGWIYLCWGGSRKIGLEK